MFVSCTYLGWEPRNKLFEYYLIDSDFQCEVLFSRDMLGAGLQMSLGYCNVIIVTYRKRGRSNSDIGKYVAMSLHHSVFLPHNVLVEQDKLCNGVIDGWTEIKAARDKYWETLMLLK